MYYYIVEYMTENDFADIMNGGYNNSKEYSLFTADSDNIAIKVANNELKRKYHILSVYKVGLKDITVKDSSFETRSIFYKIDAITDKEKILRYNKEEYEF